MMHNTKVGVQGGRLLFPLVGSVLSSLCLTHCPNRKYSSLTNWMNGIIKNEFIVLFKRNMLKYYIRLIKTYDLINMK